MYYQFLFLLFCTLLDSDKGQHNPSFQMDEHISTIDTPTINTPKTNLSTPTKVPKNKHNVTLLHVYNLDMTFPLENGTTENGKAAHVGPDEIDGTNDAVSEHHVDVSDETSADGSVVRYTSGEHVRDMYTPLCPTFI